MHGPFFRTQVVAKCFCLFMVTLSALGLVGCSSSAKTTVRLTQLSNESTVHRVDCASLRYASAFTFGVADAVNDGPSPLVLDKISLPHPVRFTLLESFIIFPRGLEDSFGLWNGFPPHLDGDRLNRMLWATRRPVESAVVRPGEVFSIVLGATGRDGASSGPVHLDYHNAVGATGTLASNITYRLREKC